MAGSVMAKAPYGGCKLSNADHRGNGEWIEVSIGILERKSATIDQGSAIIDEAVVVTEALEHLGVDETCRAEPAAAEVNSRDVASTDAHIHDLNRVGRDATWEWCCGALADHYIRLAALVVTPYSVRFHHLLRLGRCTKGFCVKKIIQKRTFSIIILVNQVFTQK